MNILTKEPNMDFDYSENNYTITGKNGDNFLIKKEINQNLKSQLSNKKTFFNSKPLTNSGIVCDDVLNSDNEIIKVSENWFKDKKLYKELENAKKDITIK